VVYAGTMGRARPRGPYSRLLFVGFLEGLDSERGIAERAADSFTLRDFLVALERACGKLSRDRAALL